MTVIVTSDIDFTRYGNVDADHIDFGFIQTGRYPTGQTAVEVATYNEFGTETIPERPFFRQALANLESNLLQELADEMRANPQLSLDANAIGKIGESAVSAVQERIVDLREPPNAPATVRRKGSSNPLVDTGFMRGQVTYEVDR